MRPPDYLTVAEIAKRLKLSRPTVLSFVHHKDPEKRLKSSRLGISLRVRVEDFEEWLRRQGTRGKAEVRNTAGRRKAAATT